MGKKIYYTYNPETDNFEREYPTVKSRLAFWGKILLLACLIASALYVLAFYILDTPTEENLKAENSRLKTQYGMLSKRLDNSLLVMDRLQDRDENLYRVMLQIDPMTQSQRLSGLDTKKRSQDITKLSDLRLIEELSGKMDLIERQIYAQVQSMDQLQNALTHQKDKLAHIPGVLPINISEYTMSSGYGYRVDPIYGSSKFHEGLDFSAATGSDVFATADGRVELARRQAAYGNCVDIDHGYNYMTRYAHLSEILVKEGEEVKRGQLIGRVGSTGKSTGPHLHYEVRFKGEPQNPVNYYFLDVTPDEYAQMIQAAEDAGNVMD